MTPEARRLSHKYLQNDYTDMTNFVRLWVSQDRAMDAGAMDVWIVFSGQTRESLMSTLVMCVSVSEHLDCIDKGSLRLI